jgi:hypothetical protein
MRQASHDWREGVHAWLKHDDIRQPVLLSACVQHFTELCDCTEQDEWALKHLRWGKPNLEQCLYPNVAPLLC